MTPPPRNNLVILGLAAAGLTTCTSSGGSSDPPPPPPINCQAVGQGQTLKGTGVLSGTSLTLTITNQDYQSYWSQAPQTANPVGLTGLSVSLDASGGILTITAQLTTPATTAGTFELNGTLRDILGNACLITKKFTVTIGTGGAVTVAQGSSPTLGPRPPIGIRMLAQNGLEVELKGTGFAEGSSLEWTVTGGDIVTLADGRVRWRLPESAGLHQVELLVDAGEGRLALESLALEVG